MIKPKLSIIIISYNTKKITLDCINSIIKSVKNSFFKYEIIVVDNDSKDGTVQSINKLYNNYSNIRIIVNRENIGFAKANNQAVKPAQGKYLLFLNSDIIVLNDAINKLFQFYKHNEDKIHFLGGKLFEKDGVTPQPSCGPFYSLPVIFAALFLKGDYWGFTRYSPNKLKKVDWVSGACILTKKEYFNKINGFDEKIFMYMDEIDLLYRAKKTGFNTFFYPDAHYIHFGSASSKGRTYPILQVYQGFLYLYKKHFPRSLFFLKLLLKLKAWLAIAIGKLTNNQYAIKTYEQALKNMSMV